MFSVSIDTIEQKQNNNKEDMEPLKQGTNSGERATHEDQSKEDRKTAQGSKEGDNSRADP